jgi:ribosomal RNA-processing protein 8
MFAVPGWSVSTSDLKPQKDSVSTQQKPAQDIDNTPANNNTEVSSKPNKRKRGSDYNGGKITTSNVNEMFRRHIEGHTRQPSSSTPNMNGNPKEGKKKRNRDRKKAKSNDDEIVNGEGHHVEDGHQQTNKKPKKDHDGVEQPSAGVAVETKTNGISKVTETIPPPPPAAAAATLTPLQQKMREKLMSARFRHLNETLYTTPSTEALELFSANPELFAEYHAGFSHQVKESWPSNPVDGYIRAIQKRGTVPAMWKKPTKGDGGPRQGATALPRRPNGLCTIADLGCGDAQLARALTPSTKKLKLKLLSYDLHVPDPLVTKADISALPVVDGSVDIAIFCLSLMGTNWVSFVEEAWRVLRGDGKGECWVSEVKSRFGKVVRKKAQIGLKRADSNNKTQKTKNNKKKRGGGESDLENDADDDANIFAEDARNTAGAGDGDETDISAFIEVFRSRGFTLKSETVDKSNKMFVRMEFIKQGGGAPAKGKYAGVGVTPKSFAPPGKKRFIDRETIKGMTPEEEAKVLKPCVYKTR